MGAHASHTPLHDDLTAVDRFILTFTCPECGVMAEDHCDEVDCDFFRCRSCGRLFDRYTMRWTAMFE